MRARWSARATIHVRDSKNPGGGLVTVSAGAWTAFLAVPATLYPKKV
ncbi:MAG: DUF397 domain-containing protein [Streptomyces sp.]|nr:DUF397 domain-containing protein [Streptomyces sp.]